MKSTFNLVGVSSCCLAMGVAAANAEPVTLADVDLDRVTAGDSQPAPPGTGLFGLGLLFPPGEINCLALGCPGSPPSGPVPTEPPGCETGACGPSGLIFTFDPVAPVEVAPLAPVTLLWTPLGFVGGCGGPAATCAGAG